MSIIDELQESTTWEYFLEYKSDRGLLSKREIKELSEYISAEKFSDTIKAISDCSFVFPEPRRIQINRKDSSRKRTVYSFEEDLNNILKVTSFLLYRYDEVFCSNCYSFRRGRNAKTAVRDILSVPSSERTYFYRTDIKDYFNSIPSLRLSEMLAEVITDDDKLLDFLRELISIGGEDRGAMAGVPVSSFFANLYLTDVDRYFSDRGIHYFRYSDDIIFFSDDPAKLEDYKTLLLHMLEKKGLIINLDKEVSGGPDSYWEFLGFRYWNGKISVSEVSLGKIKKKIKRKAHSLYRWRRKKDVDFSKTAGKMIRIFNKKFFDETDENGFTWTRWYFPVINDTEVLKDIDRYMVENIRYLYSGRYYKGNYRISYDQIKALGYRSLVNEYYRYKQSVNNAEH